MLAPGAARCGGAGRGREGPEAEEGVDPSSLPRLLAEPIGRRAGDARDGCWACCSSAYTTSYIDAMVERCLDNGISPCKARPASWGFMPTDDTLTRAYEAAINHRTSAPPKLFQEYNSIVGSLRHAVKYRPEIAAAMDLLDCCLMLRTRPSCQR